MPDQANVIVYSDKVWGMVQTSLHVRAYNLKASIVLSNDSLARDDPRRRLLKLAEEIALQISGVFSGFLRKS